MGVELAEKLLGPLGGDLTKRNPEWRNTQHKGQVGEDGVIGFHDMRECDKAHPGLQKEKPWHRMAAIMLNKGFTNKEIAEMADFFYTEGAGAKHLPATLNPWAGSLHLLFRTVDQALHPEKLARLRERVERACRPVD